MGKNIFFWVLLVFFEFFIFLLLKAVHFDKNLEILIKMHFFKVFLFRWAFLGGFAVCPP